MTYPDAMKLLTEKVNEIGQAEVARRIGKSPAAVSQIMSGTYKAAPDEILKRVIEVFGGMTITCPVLGEIPLSRCAEKRKLPFAATNPQRVALYRACQICPQNGGKP